VEEIQTAGEAGTPDGVFEHAPSCMEEEIQALFEGSGGNAQALEQVPGEAPVTILSFRKKRSISLLSPGRPFFFTCVAQ